MNDSYPFPRTITMVQIGLGILFFTAASFAADFYPQDRTEFRAMRDVAQPGDRIILPAGELDWGQLYVGISGTAEAPITIQAPTVYATTLTNSSYFQIAGSHIVIKGFKFRDTTGQYPVWLTTGKHNRVTQCYFEETEASSLLRSDGTVSSDPEAGSYLRIDHSFFTTTTQAAITIVGPNDEQYVGQHVIEYNVFRDAPRRRQGAEAIILYSLGKHEGAKTHSTVRFNVFDQWDSDIEAEIVSIKSGGNTFYRNVFAWCRGYFSLRRENENVVDSNLFYHNTEGIWVYGENHLIINNIIEGVGRRGLNMRSGWIRENDGIEGRAAVSCIVANNTFIDIERETFSFEQSGSTFVANPSDNQLINNILHTTTATGILVNDEINFVSAENTVDNNLVFSSNHSYGPVGTRALQTDAELTGTGYQLRLTTGSPAIGAGIAVPEVSHDFFGNARSHLPDIGHHEFSTFPSPVVADRMPPIPPERSTFREQPLEAAFTAYPDVVQPGEPVNLDASISKGPVDRFTWDLGDGHSYTGSESFYPYDWSSPGTKVVTLTVYDANGHSHAFTRTIRVGEVEVQAPWTDSGEDWLGWIYQAYAPWYWSQKWERFFYQQTDSRWIYLPR